MVSKEEIEKYVFSNAKFGKINLNSGDKIIPEIQKFAKGLYQEVLDGKFHMNYQPIFESDLKTTKSAETLFRHDGEYKINPEVAFVLFKTFGYEKQVLNFQIEKICAEVGKMVPYMGKDFCVSVNVASELLTPEFVNKLYSNLSKNGLSTKNIKIELLEYEDFGHFEKSEMETINKLKKDGVKFSLDDFGSKNANENAFGTVDFDFIKIDRSVIVKKEYDKIERAFKFAEKNKNVKIIFEGIDDKEVAKELKNHNKNVPCQFQGWAFSKDLDFNSFDKKYNPDNPNYEKNLTPSFLSLLIVSISDFSK